ncbi:DUF3105 domain-containing protein [Candidatus Kaiserbacteria bacterium]|nr:DUF3105 domain-containing protein [Candidatus Kaiserbacteria bacterium]
MKIFFASVGALILLVVGLLLWSSLFGPAPQGPRPFMGEKMPDEGATHVARGQTHADYNSNPPTSGPHWEDGVAGAGVKTQQAPDELILHSMEHGAAVVWYRADLPPDQIEQIQAAFDAAKVGKKIMTPRAGLDVPVALTSWGYLLKLDAIDAGKITEFILSNNDRGPEKAPI